MKEKGSIPYYQKIGHDQTVFASSIMGRIEVPTGTCHAI